MRPLALIVPLVVAGCAAPASGLRPTPPGDGPVVLVDWEAEPLPEVPWPNDLSTAVDPTSPTGLRLNIPTEAETVFETEARHKINELPGFGVYAPITVSFEAPLDIGNLVDRHPDDLHLDTTFDDDAVFLVDVDPDSEGYGTFHHLDLGHGRYPADVFRTDRYFPNDTRAAEPSIIFDTVDEDLNGNGILDPGEDTDNDGLLDVPNVFPKGGDPFEDLLTFYDCGTDTLILRPVVPLREETTYAVVLTERLVGEDGLPIRSPWPYVHHTRQGDTLAPLEDILPSVGLGLEDVAFAWTFTTGRPTADLRDLADALYDGEGPYAHLQATYPAGFVEGHVLHELDGLDPLALPADRVLDILVQFDAVGSGEGTEVLRSWYESFSDVIVGGSFVTPYLLADADEGGAWDADEWFKVDPFDGSVHHAPQRVVYSCVLPKVGPDGGDGPFPVAIYGHGYGSNRLEILLFAPAVNRMGYAACSFDFPGHGVDIGDDEKTLAEALLTAAGLPQTLHHFFDTRARDLDNDGSADSGGDQWTADPFHTRDMVRQASLDWIQFTRALRTCGSGTMTETDLRSGGERVSLGERVACDHDGDGAADFGGPDVPVAIFGGSLGGINSGVAIPIVRDIEAWAPIVPGGGIVDVGIRTQIGGAVEAFVGRLVSPLFVGIPQEDGSIQVQQLVNSVTSMRSLPVGTFTVPPGGGEVVITNLTLGLERRGLLPEDGRFRLAIAADAMNAHEKAVAAGIPSEGPMPDVAYTVPDNAGLGDELLVEIRDADGALVASFDTWPQDVVHEGITMPAGSPLVAGDEGNGRIRGSHDARRLAYISALILEPGDPIAYAPHYFLDPLDNGPQNVLIMPTPGDDQVPINAGIALARAAGVVDWQNVDPRYGTTPDRFLIDRRVVQGVEERGPYTGAEGTPVLFDADDLDEGQDDYGAPSDAPLRLTVDTPAGQSGLRLPYVDPTGIHGFREPNPSLAFDINTYAITQIADYLTGGGQQLRDRLCYEDASCDDIPQPVGGE